MNNTTGRKISHSHPEFINLIYKLVDKCCVDLIEYIVKFGCEDVDSFITGMYRVEITGNRDGQKIKKHLIVKWHPDSKKRSNFREAYRREYLFFRHIVPRLLEVQKSFKIIEGLKIKFPNCIFASIEYDNEAIATEDLCEDKWRFHHRLQNMDLQHVLLVMKNFAKLHALSFVLAKTNPKEFAWLCSSSKDVQYFEPGPVPKSMKSFYEYSVGVVVDSVAREKLEDFGPHILTALYKCTQSDEYSTICHGDCWNNNVLFKYKGERPVEVIFIDYQLARIASPVTDIAYFLYMSTDREFTLKYYEHVLDVYYGTLGAVLRQCNLDVNEIYPQTIFKKHLREYSVLGLIEALVSMMIITAENEEALKMTEMKYENCDESLCENEQKFHDVFVERVNGVVSDFFERNYSLDAVLYQ